MSRNNTLLDHVRATYASLRGYGMPALTPHQTASATAIAFSAAYVAPFYLLPSLRISSRLSRNDPTSIRARCQAVYTVCALCTALTIGIHLNGNSTSTSNALLSSFGVWPIDLVDTARTMTLLCLLYLGPLYEELIVDGAWRAISISTTKARLYDDWTGWRNYIVGPASEELIFRSLNVSLLLRAGVPAPRIVLEAPLLFGLAHLHHLNEFILSHRRHGQSYLSALVTPRIIVPGLVTSLFQLGFTTLFGTFVTFVFLRTGSVWSCLLAHVFCNLMGLPRVWGRVGGAVDEREGEVSHASVWPTVVYYVLLVAGMASFYVLLWPLTQSSNALTEI